MALSERELAMPAWAVWEERQRQRYLDRANLPKRATERGLDDLEPQVRKAVREFADRCKTGDAPVGLLLYGRPGRGKTTAAMVALVEALKSGPHEWLGRAPGVAIPPRPGYYLSYPEFLRIYKDSWRDGEESIEARTIIRSLFCSGKPSHNCRVSVLDDVGKEHHSGTGFNVNVLHDLLRSRWDRDSPSIITTNMRPEQWEPQYGEAMASFIKEAFVRVEVKGADRRAQ